MAAQVEILRHTNRTGIRGITSVKEPTHDDDSDLRWLWPTNEIEMEAIESARST